MIKQVIQSIFLSIHFTALNYFVVTQDLLRLSLIMIVSLLTSLFFIIMPVKAFKNIKVSEYGHFILFTVFLPLAIIYKDFHTGALHVLLILSCLKLREINQ